MINMPEIRFLDNIHTQELIDETKRRISSGQAAAYTTTSPLTDSTNALVQGLTIYGRSEVVKSNNLFNPVGLINAGWNKNADGSYSGVANALYKMYKIDYKPTIAFKPQTQYTISFDSHGESTSKSLIVGFNTRDSGENTYWNQVVVSASSYTHYTLTSPVGHTINELAFSYSENQNVYIKNFIVSEGSQEHEYEPYFERIKSVGDAGWGVVDLGTLTWGEFQAGTQRWFSNALANLLSYGTRLTPLYCQIYDTIDDGIYDLSRDKVIYTSANPDAYIFVQDHAFTDANAFKSAMNGVILYYPLADASQADPLLGITSKNGEGQGTAATITTGLPLRSVSDTVRDKLTCTAESKQVETVCGKVRLADLTWTSINDNTLFMSAPINDMALLSLGVNGICNKYPVVKMTYTSIPDKTVNIGNLQLSATARITIRDNDYTTVSDFVASLGDAELVYQLAEPVTTPLTDAEISAFRGLHTYNNTTNITISDNPDFEIDYLKNSENGQAIADVQKDLQGQIDEVKNTTKPRVYAFYIDQNDSNPAICCRPYYNTKYGCDNLFYQNAYMDYEKDEFNYGSWKEFIYEFFKPCMLAYDGHVDYYLDPDDYETKLDGGTSDIKNMTYNGNVMVQIKTLYFKRWTTGGKYYCIISDKKLDKSFKAFAHHDIKGNVLDYIYRAAYDGSYDGTRLRSISGIDYHNLNALTANKIMSNTTRQQEINFAKANNDANEKGEGWNILHKAEWDLINDLLLLIGMSTNTRATFGNGNISSYKSTSDTGIIATGTMDKKGLFYGKNDNVSGVKVFGIEMPWGNIWKSCLGWILSANQHLVKMTPGNEDGSTATDYNLDGTGYVATGKSITANGYISAFDGADTGFLPTEANGSATTYMCNYVWQNTAIYFALVGGYSDSGVRCGAFYSNLTGSAAHADWDIGAALSYKGLANSKTNK